MKNVKKTNNTEILNLDYSSSKIKWTLGIMLSQIYGAIVRVDY